MNQSLAYRIMTGNFALSDFGFEYDHVALKNRCKALAHMVKKATKVRLDNVARFYVNSEKEEWDCRDDIPKWAPPFHLWFAEWQHPFGVDQLGAMVLSADVEEWTTGDMMGMLQHCTGTNFKDLLDHGSNPAELHEGAKWITCMDLWVSSPRIGGKAMLQGTQCFTAIDKDGKWIRSIFTGMGFVDGEDKHREEKVAHVCHCERVIGLATSFMHCKNVTRGTVTEHAKPRLVRQTGCPATIKYHTINIDPMKEVLRREGGSESVGMKKALHICRGHFANYTVDKPLFGHFIGTVWRPDHVRGSLEKGKVVSSYDVTAVPPPAASSAPPPDITS